MTGNLKIISDSRIRYIVTKGPNYRFPSRIDFKKCRGKIASALNDFGGVIDGVNASMLSLTP